jgi:glutamate-ammonia-ligase adenylyltransferase
MGAFLGVRKINPRSSGKAVALKQKPAITAPLSNRPDPSPILLATGVDPAQVRAILSAYGLRDVAQADQNLQAMAGDPYQRKQLASLLPMLLDSVARTADPDQALNHWERLLATVTRSSFLEYVHSSPRMLDLVCTIFGNSDSLAFTLIRDPALVYWLAEEGVLAKPPTRAGLETALDAMLGQVTAKELKLEALRRFRRREMLRIGVRDLLHLADVPETTASLSDLAGVLIHAAYEIVDDDLQRHYGVPMHRNRRGTWMETGFAVIGMGKLGGHELNYSSDVDLIYVYESHEGETRAPRSKSARAAVTGISNEEFFELLSRDLTKALSEPTKEGHVFRVDLRLRAEGSVGQLARSLDDYKKYYATRGQVWERLALLKAWPVAGSPSVGQAFLKIAKPFIFGAAAKRSGGDGALSVVRDVRGVKEIIDAKMADRGHERRNVKLGTGGIREIEFLVQTIQVLAGKRVPAILDRSTLGSLDRLARRKLISRRERDDLRAAYLFLRDVEHKLQMVHELQTHALPDYGEELERCAIRAGYQGRDRSEAVKQFQADHGSHTAVVHNMFRSFFETPKASAVFLAAVRAMKARR